MTVALALDTPTIMVADSTEPYRWYEKIKAFRVCVGTYYGWNLLRRDDIETPRDTPNYRTREKAWRVLLVGNGPTHGWGVVTHNLSLTGQIARSLTRQTGQHVDVDYVGDEMMGVQTTLNWLKDTNVADYDELIFVLSMNDAARLTDTKVYKKSVNMILDRLRTKRRAGVNLLVVGIQPIKSVLGYQNWLGEVAQRHADRLNKIMQEEVESVGDRFMDLSEPIIESGRPLGSALTYQTWAEEIAATAAPLLPAGEPGEITVDEKKEWDWVAGEELMNMDGEHDNDYKHRLRAIAEAARKRFLAQTAYVTLIQDDNQYLPHARGIDPSRIPLELTYCRVAATQDEPLVVPNGYLDERFKDSQYIKQTQLPFYIGQSMKSRDGEVIGSFCVMAATPRPASLVSVKQFKKYADQAQEELWRIEDEVVAKQQDGAADA